MSASATADRGGSPVAAVSDDGKMRSKIVFKSADWWFRGRFEPTSFSVSGDQIMATGMVTGLVHLAGERTEHVSEEVSMPVTGMTSPGASVARMGMGALSSQATCDILNLVLGPLDLNLLGLEIHLDTVVRDIIANPAGGLLGDLLCAIANLLDDGPLEGLLAQLVELLEEILGILNV